MALIYDSDSGLPVGDPQKTPVSADEPALTEESVDRALSGMILSASGWRGIFAADGDEESPAGEISAAHKIFAAAAARVFAAYLKERGGKAEAPLVIVGMDTRPTGPAIADLMIRVFLAEGCAVRYAFITAAPEIMAYTRNFAADGAANGAANGAAEGSGPAAGFVFISASHNPIGHNGLKFGLTGGGVLPGEETAKLIVNLKALLAGPDRIESSIKTVCRAKAEELERIYAGVFRTKKEARAAYLSFTREVITGARGELYDGIREALEKRPAGIVADLNGSARTVSIDREFITGLGAKYLSINDEPGKIAHRIVPEGESLEPCRVFLEQAHREDPAFALGYVPDCDGDRGNLVIWDEAEARARALEAQEVFALACVSELAHLVWTGELSFDNRGNALQKAAVAVNDPTSMRIDRIAHAFDASVFRAEVGEANVVSLAQKLRSRGYLVRILGEGSAGGSITHPSAVRDPVNTLMALLKLLSIRSTPERRGFFELWCDLSDQAETYHPDFGLSDIIASLPAFVTTGAYTPEAALRVKTADHGLLKERYQKIFLREWEARKEQLARHYGITGWEAAAYNGVEEKRGIRQFGEAGRGGLRIVFSNRAGNQTASIWMRGSGTEPVFRVMADVEGQDMRLERDLIEWQRRMVTEADCET
ncbi:MAG: phosphatidylglycerol lysyltransferase [Treponema sp.]|jgi:phosphoglucomutase|nr:phosphatidylglycerol lysyltransferase [Treponema sp.]